MSTTPSDDDYVSHPIQVRNLRDARVIVFDDELGSALIEGQPTDGALVRIQSACQYGEIYHSLECDCREQLDHSIHVIGEAGAGVIVHLLKQEGRGAGLLTKAMAYRLRHTENLDTFQAYKRLGVTPDSRDYAPAVNVLRHLGLTRITLLTNNPEKISAVQAAGIAVDRQPIIRVDHSEECRAYFSSKVDNGHLTAEMPAPPAPAAKLLTGTP